MKTRNKSILSSKDNKNKSLSKAKKTKIIKRKETVKDASYRDQHNIGRRKSTTSVVTYSLDSRLFFDVYAKFNNENLPKNRNIYNGICNSSSVVKVNADKKFSNSKIKPLSVVTSKRQINSADESCDSNTDSEVSKKRKVIKVPYEAKPINSDEACIPSPQIPQGSPIKNNKVNKTFHSIDNRVIATRNCKPVNLVGEKNIKNEVQLKPSTKNETFQRLLENKTVFKKHLSQNLTEKNRSATKPVQPVLSPPSPNNTRRLSSRLNKSQNDADSVLQSNDEQSISSIQHQNRPCKKKELNKVDLDLSPPKRGKRIASLNAAAIINCVQNLFNESPKRSPFKPSRRRTLKPDANQSLTTKVSEIKQENSELSNSKINNCNITFEDIPLNIKPEKANNDVKKKSNQQKSREKIIKKQPEKNVKKPEEKIAQNSEEKPTKKTEEKPTKKAEEKPTKKAEEKPTKKAEEKPTKKAEEKPTKKAEEKPVKKSEEKSVNKIEENPEKKTLKKLDEKIKKSEHSTQNGEHLSPAKNFKKIENKETNLPKIKEEKPFKKVEEEIKIEKSSKKLDEKIVILGEKEKLLENNLIEKSKRIDIKLTPPLLMKNQKRSNNISRFFDITTKSNSKHKDVAVHGTQINRKPKTFTVERVVKKRIKNVDECFEEFAKSSGSKKLKKNQHDDKKQTSISVDEEDDNGESFWEWEGEAYKKSIQLQLAGELVERTCYNAIRHTRDDVIIRTTNSVMLRSSADQEPFLAKIIVFYLDEETGKKMMTLLWYYRPEHTEQGRLEWHTESDVYASRHLDNNSVDCIEDKAFVLPVEIFSRFMAYQKRQSAGTRPGLAARLIPVNNDESITSELDENKLDNCTDMFISNCYYTFNFQNSFPSEMTNSNVFVCRGLYDINQHKITRNILQNIQSPKLEPVDPCDSVDSAMSISSCESEHKEVEETVEVPSVVIVTEIETPLSDIPIPPTKLETISNNCLPPISSFQHILPKPQTDTTVPVLKSCPPPPPSKPIQPPLPNTTNGDVTDCPKQPNGHP